MAALEEASVRQNFAPFAAFSRAACRRRAARQAPGQSATRLNNRRTHHYASDGVVVVVDEHDENKGHGNRSKKRENQKNSVWINGTALFGESTPGTFSLVRFLSLFWFSDSKPLLLNLDCCLLALRIIAGVQIHGLVVSSVEQNETPTESLSNPQLKN